MRIKPQNIPIYAPTTPTLLAYLMLDKFNASQLIWGIAICFFVLVWIGFIYSIFTVKHMDVIDEINNLKDKIK